MIGGCLNSQSYHTQCFPICFVIFSKLLNFSAIRDFLTLRFCFWLSLALLGSGDYPNSKCL